MKVLQDDGMELETTTLAVVAAHEAYGRDLIESVGWERRGLLQRLVRVEASDSEGLTADLPVAA